ncbi:hypothetical protein CRUP_022834 [Coryphaenoides rupestris]|nr:hypothetical protein CRUP_022834 [Coryphaenoides rupestris]
MTVFEDHVYWSERYTSKSPTRVQSICATSCACCLLAGPSSTAATASLGGLWPKTRAPVSKVPVGSPSHHKHTMCLLIIMHR